MAYASISDCQFRVVNTLMVRCSCLFNTGSYGSDTEEPWEKVLEFNRIVDSRDMFSEAEMLGYFL